MDYETCTLCDEPYLAKGYCRRHYWANYHHGDPHHTLRKTRPRNLSGEELLRWYGWETNARGCWVFSGGEVNKGHSRIPIDGRMVVTHRYAYEVWVGPIPKGKMLLHSCDNGPCINPKHLRPGTHKENMRDMKMRKRAARGEHNGNRVLTENDVLEIRELYKRGETQQAISEQFGTARTTIGQIVRGDTWTHLI